MEAEAASESQGRLETKDREHSRLAYMLYVDRMQICREIHVV